ncbi:hypothetical protein JCM11251_002457 [Rhodosporidiobolus azoricus]
MSDDDAQYAFTVPPPGAPVDASEPSTSSSSTKPSKKRKSKDTAPVAEQEDAAPEAAVEGEEEKPLSHKEKRLAKKRKLAAEAAAAEGGEEGGEVSSAPTSAPAAKVAPAPTMIGSTLVGNTPARSAHGVWVGNMNFATHARELLAWFAERGLKEVTRINMPNGKRAHENNRGFAYLDFPSETDVTIAVGLSEQHLDGRKLLIKSSSDYTGRPAPSSSTSSSSAAPAAAIHADESTLPPLDPSALDPSAPPAAPGAPQTLNRTARKILDKQKNPPGPTLFIGNLGFETKVEDIRDMFDRNQKRAAEWAPKEKGKKGEKSGKKPGDKGKGKEKKEGDDEEDGDEEKADTDRDEDESDSDDDEEEGEKENGADGEDGEKRREKKDKGKKGPIDLAQAKDAGIRKVRLGTFEDSGKCKGWCFVDFHLPAQATRALLNLRNHTLNGRKLNVEFASADAVRRGGLGSRAVSKAHGRQRREGGGREEHGGDGGRERKRSRHDGEGGGWDDGNVRDLAASGGYSRDAPPHGGRRGGFGGERDDARGKKGGVADGKRAKPGAALANAQRASEAIVASTGRKTTFD